MSAQVRAPTILQPLPDNDRVRVCHYRSLDQFDSSMLDRWQDLADNAVCPNAYLAPGFLVSSLECLTAQQPFLLAVSERRIDSGWQSIGLGVFRESAATKTVPFPHLHALRSPHGFLGGLLLRESCHDEAVERFFADFVQCDLGPWRAIEVTDFPMDRLLTERQRARLSATGIRWIESGQIQRATIRPSAATDAWPNALLSSRSAKSYARRKKKLANLGSLEHRLVWTEEITDEVVERFLKLEHTGFRKDAGTSLLSHANHVRFFRQMVHRLRDSREVFFSELASDGQVIASTCNLVSGSCGFAFKLGWNPDFGEYSPGVQNELAIVGAMRDELAYLDHMDSGALQGSFMERLWPDRDELVEGVFACDRFSHWTARAIRSLADFRNRWRRGVG